MKYLSTDAEVMGGELVIKGTRTPIVVLLSYLKDGHSLQDIHEMFSWISLKNLRGGIEESISLLSKQNHAQSVL
jgi:uncharacterized protein (DUF433 family)